MSFERLLNHKCDIYHLISTDSSKYGLPSETEYSYPEAPDLIDVPCHFNIKNGSDSISQSEPQNNLYHTTTLILPFGTDIRINDKVIDKETGLEYTAEVPRNIRGHHIKVKVYRKTIQEAL
jgi:hypothetical protein